jgi:hypothetical protein
MTRTDPSEGPVGVHPDRRRRRAQPVLGGQLAGHDQLAPGGGGPGLGVEGPPLRPVEPDRRLAVPVEGRVELAVGGQPGEVEPRGDPEGRFGLAERDQPAVGQGGQADEELPLPGQVEHGRPAGPERRVEVDRVAPLVEGFQPEPGGVAMVGHPDALRV